MSADFSRALLDDLTRSWLVLVVFDMQAWQVSGSSGGIDVLAFFFCLTVGHFLVQALEGA